MDYNKYKKILKKEKNDILSLVKEMQDNTLFGDTQKHTSQKYASGELSGYDNHLGDMATDLYMETLQNSLTDHERGKLYQVEKALGRLEEGTYGVCTACNKSIEEERLDIVPYTDYCSECAKQNDNLIDENKHVDLGFINPGCRFYSTDLTDITDLNRNGLEDQR